MEMSSGFRMSTSFRRSRQSPYKIIHALQRTCRPRRRPIALALSPWHGEITDYLPDASPPPRPTLMTDRLPQSFPLSPSLLLITLALKGRARRAPPSDAERSRSLAGARYVPSALHRRPGSDCRAVNRSLRGCLRFPHASSPIEVRRPTGGSNAVEFSRHDQPQFG